MVRKEARSIGNMAPVKYWQSFSLARKFLVMGGLVVIVGAFVIGSWVSRQIADGVTRNTAIATALYVDSFISPLTGELENRDILSIGPIRALDEAFKDSPLASRLHSVKIWKPDGTIVYSNDYELIGRKFEITEELKGASRGEVMASFDNLGDQEDEEQRKLGIPLLEIYSPIRAPWSGDVIAVTEFYENGEDLMRTIADAKRRSWLLVGAVMSAMAGLLMTIVFQGSRTIDKQRLALQEQLKVANEASDQNRRLRNRVQKASERVSELNEHFLRKTSAELHDGPAQLLSFAALRIGEIRKIRNTNERNAELELIGNTLDTAMKEIRNLSKGLSLPEVDELSVQAIIKRVIRQHEERTKSTVLLSAPQEEIDVSKPVKIAIYRFVQEALNNCWKHAEGSEVSILCKYEENTGQFEIDVVDRGPGFDPHSIETGTEGLGISGLRERTRSIGGELQIVSLPGEGTTLKFNVNLMGNLEMSDQRI